MMISGLASRMISVPLVVSSASSFSSVSFSPSAVLSFDSSFEPSFSSDVSLAESGLVFCSSFLNKMSSTDSSYAK